MTLEAFVLIYVECAHKRCKCVLQSCIYNTIISVYNLEGMHVFFFYHCRTLESLYRHPGTRLNKTTIFPGMGIFIIKLRRSDDCLIFTMGILILVSRQLYIETGRWFGQLILVSVNCRPSFYVRYPINQMWPRRRSTRNSNYIHHKVWHGTTWEWIYNIIPPFTAFVFTYPCWD